MGSAMLKALRPKFPKTKAYDKGTNLQKVTSAADVIIFAVKPQDFTKLDLELSNKLVISIMAGISIKKIAAQIKSTRVVRTMPNLPLQIQEGLTGWIASKNIKARDKRVTKKILKSFGQEIELKKESEIEKITPLSGSGPAYFFYICKLIQKEAQARGFSKADAKKIAEQTFIGAAKVFEKDKKSADEWITAVASKKGVTEQVIKHFDKEKFPKTFKQAITKGIKRSKELETE